VRLQVQLTYEELGHLFGWRRAFECKYILSYPSVYIKIMILVLYLATAQSQQVLAHN
jgi:hypothetical protein